MSANGLFVVLSRGRMAVAVLAVAVLSAGSLGQTMLLLSDCYPFRTSSPSQPWEGAFAGDGPMWTGVNPRTLARQTDVPLIGWQIRGGMSLDFGLVHNSMATRSNAALGTGEWLTTYDVRLVLSNGNTHAEIEWAHLKQELNLVNGVWVAADGYRDTLAPLQTGGTFLLTGHDQTKYTFDATTNPSIHRLKSIKDTSNNAITLVYSATTGKLTQVKDPNARRVQLTYSVQTGRLSNIKFMAGTYSRMWTFAYDANGRLNKITYPTVTTEAGPQVYTELFSTDPATNNLTSITDRAGKLWQFGYSSDAAQWAQWPGNNNAQRVQYVDTPQGSTLIDPTGVSVTHEYDGQSRLVRMIDGQNQTTTLAYGDANYGYAPSVATSPTGESCAWDLDNNGNIVGITPPGLGRFDLTYNTKNRLTKMLQPLVTDADGQVESTRRRTNYYYDSKSRLTKVREYTSVNTWVDSLVRTYSTQGLLLTEANALNQVMNYTYDAYGNRLSCTTPAGRSYFWEYGDGSATCGFRVPASMQITNGPGTMFAYDEWARLRTRTQADSSDGEYHYDALSRKVKMVDFTGTSTWTYGNVFCDMTTDGGGWTAVFSRDAAGRPLTVTETGGFGQAVITNTYNSLGLLATKSDGGLTMYTYDGAHRLVEVLQPNGLKTRHDYTSGLLTGKTVSVNNIVKYEWDWNYNPAGGLMRRTEAVGGEQAEYFTDLRNRLTRETVTGPFNHTVEYAYDNASRRTSRTTDGNPCNFTYDSDGLVQTLSAPNTVYGWDAAGRMTSIQDMNGPRTFGWDDAGRMTEAVSPFGREEYRYDSLSRKARYTEKDPNGNTLSDSAFRNLGGTLRRQERTVGQVTTQAPVRFGPGGLESAWDLDNDGEYGAVTDNTGTRGLFDDSGNAVPFAAVYDAFGRTLEHTGSDTVYQWGADAGSRTEGAAGIVYNGHAGLGANAWYEPEAGVLLAGLGAACGFLPEVDDQVLVTSHAQAETAVTAGYKALVCFRARRASLANSAWDLDNDGAYGDACGMAIDEGLWYLTGNGGGPAGRPYGTDPRQGGMFDSALPGRPVGRLFMIIIADPCDPVGGFVSELIMK